MTRYLILAMIISVFGTAAKGITELENLEVILKTRVRQCAYSKSDSMCTESEMQKLKLRIEEAKKNQTSKESKEKEALTKTPQCEEEGYKSCFMGISWGDQISTLCDDRNLLPMSYDRNSMQDHAQIYFDGFQCDKVVQNNLLPTDKRCVQGENICTYKVGIGGEHENSRSCSTLSLNKKLVGFYRDWKNISEDEYFLLISKFKKKYGKSASKSNCTVNEESKIEVLNW